MNEFVFIVVKSKKAKKKQTHLFVFFENLRRTNLRTVLSDLCKLHNWGHTIAGVVSWSPHQKGLCGYKPGVYTRISEVRKWIKRKTQV